MADGTSIEWARHPVTGKGATWNPITGCSLVSPGCTNCYAMKLAGTRLKHHWSRKGLTRETKAGPVWTGEVRLNKEWLDQPLRWTAPRGIFVCAHGDPFAEGVPEIWLDHVHLSVMLLVENGGLASYPTIATEHVERRSGKQRTLAVKPSYCPFCGTRYEQSTS